MNTKNMQYKGLSLSRGSRVKKTFICQKEKEKVFGFNLNEVFPFMGLVNALRNGCVMVDGANI